MGVPQTVSGTVIRCSVGDDSRRYPLRSAAPELAISTGGGLIGLFCSGYYPAKMDLSSGVWLLVITC